MGTMNIWTGADDAATYIAKRAKAVKGPIADRLQDMLRHASKAHFPDCVGATFPIKVERVSSAWPLAGSVYVRNSRSGQRYRLWLDRKPGGKWKVDKVGG